MSGSAVALDGRIYVVGGEGGTDNLLRYHPERDDWSTLSPMSESREHFAAVAVGGHIYALAGRWQGVGERKSAEVYDPATDRWSPVEPMHIARGGFGAATLGGIVYAAGGEVLSGNRETLRSVEAFDPATGGWVILDPIPVALHGVPMVSNEGALYLLGGSDRAGAIENEGRVLIYRP
jgi:hypothetical protein